jgi:hypothetical protein
MPQDIENFFLDFQNSVKASAVADSTFSRRAFVDELSKRLSDAEEIDALISCEFEGVGAKNKKIAFDGYDFGDEEDQAVFAVADFRSGSEIETLNTSETRKLFSNVEAYIDGVISGNLMANLEESSMAFQVAGQLLDVSKRLNKIKIYLLTNAKLSDSVRSFASSQVAGIEVEYHLWDIARLFRVQSSKLGREEIDIDLTAWSPAGVPALDTSQSETDVRTLLLVMPGEMLAGIYERFGSRVLEANVRSFLSTRGKVNAGIKGTVLQSPELFLAFNNGISATASSITSRNDGKVETIESIQNLQIVNGGQTTASLFYVKKNEKADLSRVFVQMKLIIVDEARSNDLVPKISRFANTQNRISEPDFFSNHPFHQRMEEKSRQLLTPTVAGQHIQSKWFYERTRGQYLNEKSKGTYGQSKRFELEYPRSQAMTKTDAAKYLVSWDQRPDVVSSGAQKNFLAFAKSISEAWALDDSQFGDSYFRALVAQGILFNTIRTRVAKADWYSTGYLANIVTYTVAKLAHEIGRHKRGATLDFQSIWKQQSIAEGLFLDIDNIAHQVFLSLTSDEREVVNVTEWAKRAKCWDIIKDLPIELSPNIDKFLTSTSEQAEIKRESKKAQQLDSGINLQILVTSLGPKYWVKLRDFGRDEMHALSDKELGIIKYVTGEAGNGIPTEAQSKVLGQVKERIEAMGFVGPETSQSKRSATTLAI